MGHVVQEREGARPRIFEFTVEGAGEFPFDMLAHDACYPRTREDAIGMLLALPRRWRRRGVYGDAEEERIHRIRLATSLRPPSIERWQAYGWRVIDDARRT